MSLFQPITAEENLRRTEKRLARLERRKGGAPGSGTGGLIVGSLVFWPGTAPVPTFLIPLDGRTLVNGVVTHSTLAALHPEWVVGSNIVLPNYGGRTMVSRLPGDADLGTLGALYGSKTHTLTVAQMPAHSHAQPYLAGNTADQTGTNRWRVASGAGMVTDTNLMAQTGGGGAHNNMQPSAVGLWCVVAGSSIGDYDPMVQAALVSTVSKIGRVVENRLRRSSLAGTFGAAGWATVNAPYLTPDIPATGGINEFNGTWVIPENGLYHVYGQYFTGTTGNTAILAATLNTTALTGVGSFAIDTAPNVGNWCVPSISMERKFVAGDVIRFIVYNSTVNVVWPTDADRTFFGIRLIRAD